MLLVSAPGAGIYAGAGWFRSLIAAANEAVTGAQFFAFLDCGDQAGAALAAIRGEAPGVIFAGRDDVARRLADIARQHGVRFTTSRSAAALDLGDHFFADPGELARLCAAILRSEECGGQRSPR